ncbi:hypothetical protein MMC07_002715 [Pseudocyphellaria aurata]|nr:hypothetical protein [Pseudocyphellaria aurata]
MEDRVQCCVEKHGLELRQLDPESTVATAPASELLGNTNAATIENSWNVIPMAPATPPIPPPGHADFKTGLYYGGPGVDYIDPPYKNPGDTARLKKVKMTVNSDPDYPIADTNPTGVRLLRNVNVSGGDDGDGNEEYDIKDGGWRGFEQISNGVGLTFDDRGLQFWKSFPCKGGGLC